MLEYLFQLEFLFSPGYRAKFVSFARSDKAIGGTGVLFRFHILIAERGGQDEGDAFWGYSYYLFHPAWGFYERFCIPAVWIILGLIECRRKGVTKADLE